ERAHHPGLPESVVIFDEEKINHQPDDVTRREVLARRLVRLFRETPDQLLENRTHDMVRNDGGMKIHVGEFLEHLKEEVRLIELHDLFVELETVHDVARVRREALNVRREVVREVVRVTFQLLEVES